MENTPVSEITVTYNVALVTVDNLPNNMKLISDIFSTIAREKINIDMISQAPPYRGVVNLSFTLSSDDLVKAISALNRYKKDVPNLHVEVDADNTKLSVYGEGMKNIPGVAAKLFTLLANNGIEIKLVTTSEVDISYLIFEKDVDRAIEAIKKEYNLE
ncbi:MAG: ACT domain-containing protein [Clostridiales bacterium]|nr:ACT domain-containing protein [Eubacteriales bacterium]MDH7565325.1 ACT domain-containing protein [Clostridiales bacterium]